MLPVKLSYIGKQYSPLLVFPIRLWTIDWPGNPYHKSTRSLEGLIELGIVPEDPRCEEHGTVIGDFGCPGCQFSDREADRDD